MLPQPLTDADLDELDQFLLSDQVSEETMLLPALDGYLTAIVTGPNTLMPSLWLAGVWGSSNEDLAPEFADMAQASRILGLIYGRMNDIITVQQEHDGTIEPIFEYTQYPGDPHEYTDAEMWAHGFVQGMALDRDGWAVLLNDPKGQAWLRPILLLGKEEATLEEEALVRWPKQREELAEQIPLAVRQMYQFFLPYRQAVAERAVAKTMRRTSPKVGRNDPCPCGSGKKFKQCCGAAAQLH